MRKTKYISVLLTALILASCSNSSNDKSSTDTSSAESSSLQSSAAESTAESTAAEWQTVSDCAFDDTTFTCNLGTFEAQSTEYTEPAGLEELTPYI